MIPPFTIDGYRQTVARLIERGYEVRSFHDHDARSRHLILRHDIDQSIEVAREVAEVEAREGWRSTWFVLVRTNMYNPFSKANAGHLHRILELGHEVGLHLDATFYADRAQLEMGAEFECHALAGVLGADVRIVSFHRPARDLLNDPAPIAGRIHTYMPRFTQKIGYSSDSRGQWKHGHVWEHPAVSEGRAIQLLTHAIWWSGTEAVAPRQRLTACLDRASRILEAEIAANSDVWSHP